MRQRVLMVDDETTIPEYYRRELVQSFDTQHVRTPAEAMEAFRAAPVSWAVVILDVMMPHDDELPVHQTDDGLRTGCVLFEFFRRLRPDVPIVILTNVTAREVLNFFKVDNRTRVVIKSECRPSQLAQIVERLAEQSA